MKTRLGGFNAVMASRSGVHRLTLEDGAPAGATPLSVLVAHDASSTVCDALVDHLVDPVGATKTRRPFAVTRAFSVQDAAELMRTRAFDVALVSLDLQPAPRAAARFADFVLGRGTPVVLVTRSLRWLPPSANHLRMLPWVAPEADGVAVEAAIDDALARARLLGPLDDEAGEGDRTSLGF